MQRVNQIVEFKTEKRSGIQLKGEDRGNLKQQISKPRKMRVPEKRIFVKNCCLKEYELGLQI